MGGVQLSRGWNASWSTTCFPFLTLKDNAARRLTFPLLQFMLGRPI